MVASKMFAAQEVQMPEPAAAATAQETQDRKADHLRVCLEDDVQCRVTSGLERYRLRHCALPELDYDEIDLSSSFLGRSLSPS
jgi:isopentenyl-diphosphate Delta-isomerase